jgi:hypothetical protein
MQLAGNRTHVHPIKRNLHPESFGIRTISIRARNSGKRERIKEPGKKIRIEPPNRVSQKGYGASHGTRGKHACGGNHGLTEKRATGGQLKNLRSGEASTQTVMVPRPTSILACNRAAADRSPAATAHRGPVRRL